MLNSRQQRLLRPYLEGDQPTHPNVDPDSGVTTWEWNLNCPLHEDSRRSASINVDKGVFYCQACEAGMSVAELVRQQSDWLPPSATSSNGHSRRNGARPTEELSIAKVEGWHSSLMGHEAALDEIIARRGITSDTLMRFKIGYDRDRHVYTIPIFDEQGELKNIRRAIFDPAPGRRKIWGVTGYNEPRLYPIENLSADAIILCEGEWDALMTIQNGFAAITRTAAADVWRPDWSERFTGKLVYLAHDADDKGERANRRVGAALAQVADVRIVKLPYEKQAKHGKDLTDFWFEHDRADFEQLLTQAAPFNKSKPVPSEELVTVLDTFDSRRVAEPLNVIVTIKGKRDPGYSVPHKVKLYCDRSAGAKCNACPLAAAGNEANYELPPDNPVVLAMMDSPNATVRNLIAAEFGIPGGKCPALNLEIEESQAVEILYSRPSLDHSDGSRSESYKTLKINSVGRHDTMPNNTVKLRGALFPHPRTQANEFLAWELEALETSVDRFDITPESVRLMKRFQPRQGQSPLRKLAEISKELSEQVTRIVGRPEMHALMDLVFHSALTFKFANDVVQRGWMECLIVGDTRTGKSEAAKALVRHYGAGEIIGGESASFAGIVGGLQQFSGKEWAVTWGALPINDRRLVVIDEVSGLDPTDIGKMSDIRASGEAKLTKIVQEVTHARTRAIWMGNPRTRNMGYFTYGIDAIKPLIGGDEDISRFDLAMAVTKFDVPPEAINRMIASSELRYTAEACHTLLMWAWTRKLEDITWARGAEDAVFKLALDLGSRYVEDPPLIQAANARIKIARVAVALAARTFSTDAGCQKLVVKPGHVTDAVRFIDHLYQMKTFGYGERSQERIQDVADAEDHREKTRRYLLEKRGLAKFLRNAGHFRRQDLEEILDVDRSMANSIINQLYGSRMVRKELSDIWVEPALHDILREVPW